MIVKNQELPYQSHNNRSEYRMLTKSYKEISVRSQIKIYANCCQKTIDHGDMVNIANIVRIPEFIIKQQILM